LQNLESAAASKLNENMEAMSPNFLFRGYYKDRKRQKGKLRKNDELKAFAFHRFF